MQKFVELDAQMIKQFSPYCQALVLKAYQSSAGARIRVISGYEDKGQLPIRLKHGWGPLPFSSWVLSMQRI